MSLIASSDSSGRDWTLVLPAAAVLVVYVLWCVAGGTPGAPEIARLRGDLELLRQSVPQPAEMVRLQAHQRELEAQITQARTLQQQLRFEAQVACGREGDPVARLRLQGDLTAVLENHDLVVTQDHQHQDRGTPELARSLETSTRGLMASLQKIKPQATVQRVAYRPTAAGEVILPVDPESDPSSGVELKVPPLNLRKLQVVGSYRQMLAALTEIADQFDNSLVLGLSMESPPGSPDSGQLVWTVVLRVAPSSELPAARDRRSHVAASPPATSAPVDRQAQR